MIPANAKLVRGLDGEERMTLGGWRWERHWILERGE